MQLTPVATAAAGVIAFVGDFYLSDRNESSVDQRKWAEWNVWGILSLACLLRSRRKRADDVDLLEKDTQDTPATVWSEGLSLALAACLVFTQYIQLWVGRPTAQFAFVSTTPTLCLDNADRGQQPLIALILLLLKVRQSRPLQPQQRWHARLIGVFDDVPSAALFLIGCTFTTAGFIWQQDSFPSATNLGIAFALALATAGTLFVLDTKSGASEDYQLLSATQHLKLVQSISTKAFVLSTVYLAMFTVRMPNMFDAVAVGLVATRLLGICTIFCLVGCCNTRPKRLLLTLLVLQWRVLHRSSDHGTGRRHGKRPYGCRPTESRFLSSRHNSVGCGSRRDDTKNIREEPIVLRPDPYANGSYDVCLEQPSSRNRRRCCFELGASNRALSDTQPERVRDTADSPVDERENGDGRIQTQIWASTSSWVR
jgi:hypothetical protein